MTLPVRANTLESLLATAKAGGYEVDTVKLPDGTELTLRPLAPGVSRGTDDVPRRPEESDDAFAARTRLATTARAREGHIRRYTKEFGRKRATEMVDRFLAAPGGVVP